MSVQAEFDRWAAEGRDRGMEERHWHTAREALARMPVEAGDRVLDLGTGSGYALRALRETRDAGRCVGVDASREMVANAREYARQAADDREVDGGDGEPGVEFLRADFHRLPFAEGTFDHVWSMEAFFFARDPAALLGEVRRVLRPGGTFYCAVNFFEESTPTHKWQDRIDVEMLLWDRERYREAFRAAGLHVAAQDTIPDRETEIPPAEEFPTDEWDTRAEMVERYREWGTLLTVGVAP